MDTRQMFGRRKIYTDEEYITAENVVDVLRKAQLLHSQNQNEIQYLLDYDWGKMPILGKTKEVRESTSDKKCVNRANEIITLKRGYGLGDPQIMGVKYVIRENMLPVYSVYTGSMYFEIEIIKPKAFTANLESKKEVAASHY